MTYEDLLKEYKGYTGDFYLCVEEKAKELDFDSAVVLCERLYG
jgi:hypothetical protein